MWKRERLNVAIFCSRSSVSRKEFPGVRVVGFPGHWTPVASRASMRMRLALAHLLCLTRVHLLRWRLWWGEGELSNNQQKLNDEREGARQTG